MNGLQDPDSGPKLPRAAQVVAQRSGPIVVRHGRDIDPFEDFDEEVFDNQQREQLAAIWNAVLKHRWLISGVLVVTLLLAFAVTLLMKPQYTAETVLQIDRESSQIVDVEGLTPREALTGNEFLDTQVGLLKSETLARRVVTALRLQNDPFFREQAGLPRLVPGKTVKDPANAEDALTAIVMKGSSVRQQGLSRLVSVEFTSPDPALSAQVANAMAENFQKISMERRFESSSYARQFLEERLRTVKQRLEASEKELVAYGAAEQIINVNPGGMGAGAVSDTSSNSLTAANLSSLNGMLTAAQGERIKAEQRWRQAQSVPPLSLPEAQTDGTIQSLVQRRGTLSATYQEQLRVYAPGMPQMQQLKAQIDETDKQLAAAGANLMASIRSQYEVARRQEQSLSGQVERLKGNFMDLRERNIQNTILQREVDTNRSLYEGLLQRYKEVGVAGGIAANNISVVDRALPPGGPSSPKLALNLAIGFLLGLGLAGAAVLFLEIMDEAIRTPDDVVSKLGLTVVGVIPSVEKATTPKAELSDPRSSLSEAYASARTALQFSTIEGAPPNILVTSARPSEGKSTTSYALARSFAQLGMQVLLVDADLRNPSIHRLLAVDNFGGLTNFLTGSDWKRFVHKTELDNLSVLPTGPLPPNPAELLSNVRFAELLAESREFFDVMIIDGPPVIGLADAPVLASRTAATLFVVESTVARRSVVKIAIRRLLQARAKVAGALLTKFDAKGVGYSYGYSYGYAYDYQYGRKRLANEET
jgi:succinoglycan biosynthesis transport protein ExoP